MPLLPQLWKRSSDLNNQLKFRKVCLDSSGGMGDEQNESNHKQNHYDATHFSAADKNCYVLLMGQHSQVILLLSADAITFSHILRRDAHRNCTLHREFIIRKFGVHSHISELWAHWVHTHWLKSTSIRKHTIQIQLENITKIQHKYMSNTISTNTQIPKYEIECLQKKLVSIEAIDIIIWVYTPSTDADVISSHLDSGGDIHHGL